MIGLSAPSQGDPCDAPFGFHCEYGEDPATLCNTVAWCWSGSGLAGSWEVQIPQSGSGLCPTGLPASCPATYAAALNGGIACSASESQCVYPEGTCDCDRGIGSTLNCSSPPLPTCPTTRPRYGTPCSIEAGSCQQWGDCALTVASVKCACGTWQPFCIPPP
jgi:hypothetical protein